MSSFNPAPFNSLRSFLTADNLFAEQQLDQTFSIEDRTKAVQQWSQLVAWSWLTSKDLESFNTPAMPAGADALRSYFIETVKALARQGLKNYYYADLPDYLAKAARKDSKKLTKLLTGRKKVEGFTLPQFFNDYIGKEPLIFAQTITEGGDDYEQDDDDEPDGKGKRFADYFWFGIQVDSYRGLVVDYDEKQNKFTLLISYPARPSLEDPDVLSAQELYDWSYGYKPPYGDDGYQEYYPPNPYIPTCIC